MKLRLVYYYDPDDYDTEDEEFYGDYWNVALFDENGTRMTYFGDYYHDKGSEKMEGFIEALKYIYGKDEIEIIRENLPNEKFQQ